MKLRASIASLLFLATISSATCSTDRRIETRAGEDGPTTSLADLPESTATTLPQPMDDGPDPAVILADGLKNSPYNAVLDRYLRSLESYDRDDSHFRYVEGEVGSVTFEPRTADRAAGNLTGSFTDVLIALHLPDATIKVRYWSGGTGGSDVGNEKAAQLVAQLSDRKVTVAALIHTDGSDDLDGMANAYADELFDTALVIRSVDGSALGVDPQYPLEEYYGTTEFDAAAARLEELASR